MNKLGTTKNQTMSSREIANLVGKSHAHVLRDLHSMFDQLEMSKTGYIHVWVHPQNHQEYPEFILDRDLTDCLLTGYDAKARLIVIKRWKELENIIKPSLPDFSNPVEAARAWADEKESNLKLEQQLEIDAPKVEFVNNYVEIGNSKCFRDVAAILGVKQNYFTSVLQAKNIIYKRAGIYRAYAEFSQYFDVKIGVNNYTGKSGRPEAKEYEQLRVNSDGVVYLAKRFGNPDLKEVAKLEAAS